MLKCRKRFQFEILTSITEKYETLPRNPTGSKIPDKHLTDTAWHRNYQSPLHPQTTMIDCALWCFVWRVYGENGTILALSLILTFRKQLQFIQQSIRFIKTYGTHITKVSFWVQCFKLTKRCSHFPLCTGFVIDFKLYTLGLCTINVHWCRNGDGFSTILTFKYTSFNEKTVSKPVSTEVLWKIFEAKSNILELRFSSP